MWISIFLFGRTKSFTSIRSLHTFQIQILFMWLLRLWKYYSCIIFIHILVFFFFSLYKRIRFQDRLFFWVLILLFILFLPSMYDPLRHSIMMTKCYPNWEDYIFKIQFEVCLWKFKVEKFDSIFILKEHVIQNYKEFS